MIMADYVTIGDERFEIYGIGDHDGNLHMLIRLNEHKIEDVVNAVGNGDGKIKVFNSDGKLIKEFSGYNKLAKFTMSYGYNFGKFDNGDAMAVVIERERVSVDDVTELQIALAELAGMIGG